MMNTQGGFEGTLGRIGERDAARELYRARRAERQAKRQPVAWQYKGTGKRIRRDK